MNATLSAPPPPTLWVDVDDLLHYLAHHSRPSGIQRVTFEICQALHQLDGDAGRVRFMRRGASPHDLITVEWAHLEAAYRLIANPSSGGHIKPQKLVPTPRMVPSLPALAEMGASELLLATLAMQGHAVLALARIPVQIIARAASRIRRNLETRNADMTAAQSGLRVGRSLREAAAPGDSFIVLGSPWMHLDYVHTVRMVRDELRMRFSLLIYDLIPVRRPEWCDRSVIVTFADWHRSVLPLADQIFTISRATAEDVEAWARETGIMLHNTVQPVPMGTDLNHDEAMNLPLPASAHLPAPNSYVLFVSTLEARKNHALLFRVWRRLLAELPRDQVPTLVFAGRVGWLVADLMQQLENANWLDRKIVLIRDPTDAELMELYRGCRFTLFPSLFEGWGLPVSESLALGRPCMVSNRTSLPEAGGDLAIYFDPENLGDAYSAIRAVIENPAGLDAWRDRVVREFRHVPWTATAMVLRRALDALDVGDTYAG